MANLLTLTKSHPARHFAPGEPLLEAGEAGGEMYILQSGVLSVERDGVELARITEPGSLVGEMSVLLGVDHSATVRAVGAVEARVIENAIAFLEATPLVALHVATLACQRLEDTSALLVQLKKEQTAGEPGFLERIFSVVTGTSSRDAV